MINMKVIGIGDIVYWARINHICGIYDLCELKVRTVYPNAFVGTDTKSKQAFILNYDECDETVFEAREDALRVLKEAETKKRNLTTDTSEEEE